MFMDVYHMCLDTILMCYISDEQAHNGVAKYAGDGLRKAVEEHGAIQPGNFGTKQEGGIATATAI